MAKVRREKDRWVVTDYINGKRRRFHYIEKIDADTHNDKIEQRKLAQKLGIKLEVEVQKCFPLRDAILLYASGREDKPSARNEKLYFERFYEFCSERDVEHVDDVTLQLMEEFQRYRFTQVSAATVNREFVVYRAFFQKCVHWRYRKDHPMEFLKKLRENPIARRKWTLDEIKQVSGPQWFMEVFNFIAETGARPIEITSATWDKFDRSKRTLTVRSLKNRGTGERTLLLSDAAFAQLLRLYKPTGYIFTGEHGGKLSSQWLSEVCRRIVTRAGLSKDLTLYGLRHAFARKLVKGGVNLKVVKDLMGHAKFETTEKYLEEDLEDQLRAVNLVSTANQLGM